MTLIRETLKVSKLPLGEPMVTTTWFSRDRIDEAVALYQKYKENKEHTRIISYNLGNTTEDDFRLVNGVIYRDTRFTPTDIRPKLEGLVEKRRNLLISIRLKGDDWRKEDCDRHGFHKSYLSKQFFLNKAEVHEVWDSIRQYFKKVGVEKYYADDIFSHEKDMQKFFRTILEEEKGNFPNIMHKVLRSPYTEE